ncbi:AbiV family abortive infection protein [Sphingomonas sp. SUN039]|uniref:AbiV family abortive infection protein n=1 Tax=Sphingomonas sp. SUN039 TaxID=2937787 RepID=UPI00216437DC|nr:AbiV family abortive infection protein [Sphingomonas sp. SUN039]UVO53188.1 AbiV family abortive infection protein [Sphingomonas sp. SUN039]
MPDKVTEGDHTLLSVLLQGAEKTFENAEKLFHEAEILGGIGATARALCLHQISLEECSKVDSLGAWTTSLVLGFEVDQKKVLAALSRHASKNKMNAYMLEVSPEEFEARASGDWKTASELFKESQSQFHASSNQAKNASLYVDWVEGAFVAPEDRINSEMLADIKEQNATFLGYAFNNLKALRRLLAAPDDLRELMLDFVEQAQKLRADDSTNVMEASNALLSGFLEAGIAKLQRR